MKSALDIEYTKVLELVKNNGAASDDDATALMALVRGEETSNDHMRYAYDAFKREYKKETLESMLLADCTAEEIQSIVGIPKEVVELYRRFFFNTANFEDVLDRVDYQQKFVGCKHGVTLKEQAMKEGKESLMVTISRGAYHVSADTALNSVRAMAYRLSQAAMSTPIESNKSHEAFKWAQLCAKTAIDKKESTTDTVEKMSIDLESTDATTNAEKSGIDPESILGK